MIDMRLIDADKLQKDISVSDSMTDDYGIKTGYAICMHLINEQPTIEPERKKGEWNFIGNQMFECSECGTCYTQSQFYQMRVRISDAEFPKFCPNCGAKMEEGEQDDSV